MNVSPPYARRMQSFELQTIYFCGTYLMHKLFFAHGQHISLGRFCEYATYNTFRQGSFARLSKAPAFENIYCLEFLLACSNISALCIIYYTSLRAKMITNGPALMVLLVIKLYTSQSTSAVAHGGPGGWPHPINTALDCSRTEGPSDTPCQ